MAGLTLLFQGGVNGVKDGDVWVSEGTTRLGNHGGAVTLCDVSGDRLADIFISVTRSLDSNGSARAVAVHYGAAGNPAPVPQGFVPGLNEYPYQATDLLPAGDVNGDGYQDLLATDRSFTKDHKLEGAAFLYLGSKTGLVTKVSWTLLGEQRNASLGLGAAGVGDVNGDGYDDVVIGMPGFTREGQKLGRACLYLGSMGGLGQKPAWTIDGWIPEGGFGRTIATVGDLNGDGLRDFFISAPGGGVNTNLPGTVFLFFGSQTNISSHPAWQISGRVPGGAFGFSISSGGDINGDGFIDLLVGAPQVPGGQAQREGRVYLFPGLDMFFAQQPDWMLLGGIDDARLGRVISPMTDVNKDGLADFVIGVPHYSPDRAAEHRLGQAGRVDVFFGSTNGYRAGQVFSADGINSRIVPEAGKGEISKMIAPPATIAPLRGNYPFVFPLAGAFVLGAGAFWLRWSHQRAARAERARIARDLHDDLGAQLSRLQYEASGVKPETTREALLALDRAVWSVKPENDTLENLVSFVGQYGAEFFAGSGIRFRFDAPLHIPDEQLSPERRNNVFLAVKEALHNVFKHSQASEVHIRIALENRKLTIRVEDNGKGLPPEAMQNGGNGLGNMAQRMRDVQGQFSIGPAEGRGTAVTFRMAI